MDCDPVVRAVATALRNLAIDNRNKEVIGRGSLPDAPSPRHSIEGIKYLSC